MLHQGRRLPEPDLDALGIIRCLPGSLLGEFRWLIGGDGGAGKGEDVTVGVGEA